MGLRLFGNVGSVRSAGCNAIIREVVASVP